MRRRSSAVRDERVRTRVAATEPSIGPIIVGTQEDVYFPTTDTGRAQGSLNRVFVAGPGC